METFENFLKELPLIKALLIVGLSSLLWHGIKAFVETYARTRSKSIADDVNLQAEIQRLVINEEVKLTVQRLNTEKALGAMKILRLLAEIESTLIDWQLTVYFRTDELGKNETIEDLGTRDLKKVSTLLMEVMKESNAYIVLFGNEIFTLITDWTGLAHGLMFHYETAYKTSKKLNEKLDPMDKERVTTITNLLKQENYSGGKKLGSNRQVIIKKLSEKIYSSLNETTS